MANTTYAKEIKGISKTQIRGNFIYCNKKLFPKNNTALNSIAKTKEIKIELPMIEAISFFVFLKKNLAMIVGNAPPRIALVIPKKSRKTAILAYSLGAK